MTKDDVYYDGLEDYKHGTYRQEKVDMNNLAKTEFGRRFTRMGDRDPNPHIPFADVAPVLSRIEANILLGIGICAVIALAVVVYSQFV